MPEHTLVDVRDIRQHFKLKAQNEKKVLKAVDGVTLQIHKGETFGLVGESGCGKSTFGKALLNLTPLTGGQILFEGEDISTLKGQALKQFRCKAQMIFQDPSSCLNPRRNIEDILLEPYIIHNLYDKAERKRRIADLCDKVGLSQSHLRRYPHEISGGQKQRIGIARALALNPKLIVCDEPVSALDVSIQAQVINLLNDLQKEFDLTYLFISHDLSVVKHCCQRTGVMYLGKLVELADAQALYKEPLHPYTQALISAIPTVETGHTQERIVLTGDLPSPMNPPSGCMFHTRCPKAMDICKTVEPVKQEPKSGHYVRCHLYKDTQNKEDTTI